MIDIHILGFALMALAVLLAMCFYLPPLYRYFARPPMAAQAAGADRGPDIDSILQVEITRLDLEPGDVVVLRVDDFLSRDQTMWIKEQAEAVLNNGTQVMVLAGGLRLEGIVNAAALSA